MTVSGGELLVNLLKACGTEYIFCSPGTEWTPVWEALLKRQEQGDDSIKYINCRHEILAVSMAQGYAETSGKLPAVLLHASVGSLHGAMAIRNAYAARVPMLIFSGETYHHYSDGDVRAQGWHWLGLLSDIGGPSALLKGFTRWSNAVKSRDSLVDSVLRGSRIARTAPGGPVYLSVPTEVLLKPGDEVNIRPPASVAVPVPHQDDVQQAARLLVDSREPVIITEHAGKKPGTVAKLVELAELLGIPVFESRLPYVSNFPKDHSLYMGHDTSEALKTADTVLVVGGLTPWYPPSDGPGEDSRVIMLDEDSLHERLPHWGYRADIFINADIETALETIIDMVRQDKVTSEKTTGERASRWKPHHDTMLAQWENDALASKDNQPIDPRWLLYEAARLFPENAFILDETILHTRLVHQYLARPGGYIKSAYGGLGVGLGEAAGAKLGQPDRPVILLVGDGAFNYNPVLAGLGFCQEYEIPLFIIILNNGGYAAMEFGHRMMYPEGAAVSRETFLGTTISPAPDYRKVAQVFEAFADKITEPEDVEAGLKWGLNHISQGKTVLLDVVLDSTPPMMPPRRAD